MASSGTLLSDLEGSSPMSVGSGGDTDLVRKIFADMNSGSASNPIMPNQGMIMSPNPNTTSQVAMDNIPATSHIIGKDTPTAADFAAAIHGVPRMEGQAMAPPPPMPASAYAGQGNWSTYTNPQPAPMMMQEPKKNVYAQIADELKVPILVSILVFVFSLPFLNILFSHYAPMLLKPTGDLTTIGLLLKALIAGLTFWLLQRVIAPLIAM
jgi:hypothetical protein